MSHTNRYRLGRIGVRIAMDTTIWLSAGLLGLMVRSPTTLDDQQVWVPLLIIPICLVLVPAFGLPRAGWEQLRERDVSRVAIAVAAGTVVLFLLGKGSEGGPVIIPRSILALQGVLALLGMVGLRTVVDRFGGDVTDPAPPA